MTTVEAVSLPQGESSQELARSWRKLTRMATAVALLTAPALVIWFHEQNGWSWWESLLVGLGIVIVFRGLAELAFRKALPWPSLFGVDNVALREEDVMARRRAWFWRFWFRMIVLLALIVTAVWVVRMVKGLADFTLAAWWDTIGVLFDAIGTVLSSTALWVQLVFVFFLFFANFAIFIGPMLLMNITQIKSFEPGDAEWGVKLDDVRGQVEAKEEVRRVVSIWQSGEQFQKAGGKRERGVLFLGPPGTGKTMLAKALATGFNSPFVSIPGSGFAATFIGIDAIVVRYLAWKAKRLARKWGGQCIVFIDEIDAVGMRRQSLGQGAFAGSTPLPAGFGGVDTQEFYGPWGARNAGGDLVLEDRAWRDWLFSQRETPSVGVNGFQANMMRFMNFIVPGGMGGMGSLALNQLLVVMDGIDNPPFFKRVFSNRLNTLLDAMYIIPRRAGRSSLRLPKAKPRSEQIYFIGATNVPINNLDPALTRPGRMGRHVWFRTPTKNDRLDILDLYVTKVAHDPVLDQPQKRDEIARVMNGYSPAMIEQATSMALTIAHHSGRHAFVWDDLVEAITTLEWGAAIGIEYVPEESRAVAIHEAGHAVAGHAYLKNFESTRLSIRMRGGALGHHQGTAKEERFGKFQGEYFAELVWALGAMAAERVVYGENSGGVSGDVMSATVDAAFMAGSFAMGAQPLSVEPRDGESDDDARARVLERFERIGLQIMNRTRAGSPMAGDPLAAVLSDPNKRRAAAQILGQAYVAAHNLARENLPAIEAIAQMLLHKKEIFGDELVNLLERQEIRIPEIDLNDESVWPEPMFEVTRSPSPAGGLPSGGRL